MFHFNFIVVLSSVVDCVFVLLMMCMSLEWYLRVVLVVLQPFTYSLHLIAKFPR